MHIACNIKHTLAKSVMLKKNRYKKYNPIHLEIFNPSTCSFSSDKAAMMAYPADMASSRSLF